METVEQAVSHVDALCVYLSRMRSSGKPRSQADSSLAEALNVPNKIRGCPQTWGHRALPDMTAAAARVRRSPGMCMILSMPMMWWSTPLSQLLGNVAQHRWTAHLRCRPCCSRCGCVCMVVCNGRCQRRLSSATNPPWCQDCRSNEYNEYEANISIYMLRVTVYILSERETTSFFLPHHGRVGKVKPARTLRKKN